MSGQVGRVDTRMSDGERVEIDQSDPAASVEEDVAVVQVAVQEHDSIVLGSHGKLRGDPPGYLGNGRRNRCEELGPPPGRPVGVLRHATPGRVRGLQRHECLSNRPVDPVRRVWLP